MKKRKEAKVQIYLKKLYNKIKNNKNNNKFLIKPKQQRPKFRNLHQIFHISKKKLINKKLI
jgi:hypothetical protein